MRRIWMGIATASLTVSAAAQEQSSVWGAFEAGEGSGVGAMGENGAQLMLKCDKPGRNEVYAVVVTSDDLVPPAQTFTMRPAQVRFDDKAPFDDRWRFYEHSAVAINKGSERSLTRLLAGLGSAQTMQLLLYPDSRRTITLKFNVSGAQEAIRSVYEDCGDQLPG